MGKYKVTLGVYRTHEYEIDARTNEEAESIAEQYFADGEEGTVSESNIETWDSVPVSPLFEEE